MNIEQVATICHETNKAFCHSIDDHSQKSWAEAEEWQRQSAVKGVEFAIANPEAPASAQHDAWFSDKERDGWKFGPLKNPATKEHPCMVPYSQLPLDQQLKDHLFKAIVRAFVEAAK